MCLVWLRIFFFSLLLCFVVDVIFVFVKNQEIAALDPERRKAKGGSAGGGGGLVSG